MEGQRLDREKIGLNGECGFLILNQDKWGNEVDLWEIEIVFF